MHATFAPVRTDALHHMGTPLPEALTAQEAMKFGRLSGWNVRKTPLLAHVGNMTIPVPDRYAIVRDNPVVDQQVDVLGTVGKVHTVAQNENQAELLNLLADELGATFDTAGEIDGGRRAFLTLRLPGYAKVGPADKVENYLTAMMGHDGESSTKLIVTPVRVTGRSTLNMAFKGADNTFKVRPAVGAARQALEALEFTFNYLDGFQEQAEQLVNTKLTQAKFETLIDRTFGAPKNAAAPTVTRTQNKLDQMAELFSDSLSNEAVSGTAWAGLTALTEWYDHHSPVRGTPGTEADVRARKALLDPEFKNQALAMMMKQA